MNVIELPAIELPLPDAIVRRFRGDYRVDEWGLDDDLVRTLAPLARLRWSIEVSGASYVPPSGPALLVYSRRVGISEPAVLGAAVLRASRRIARFPGIPDRAPVGPFLRRLGGVLGRADELTGLLRAGELVAVPLGRELVNAHLAGRASNDLVTPAVATGAPVVPVALRGAEVGRRWRVGFGEPIVASSTTRAPLAAAELAERSRRAVQHLLEDQA